MQVLPKAPEQLQLNRNWSFKKLPNQISKIILEIMYTDFKIRNYIMNLWTLLFFITGKSLSDAPYVLSLDFSHIELVIQ